jgi:Rrf2 family protein
MIDAAASDRGVVITQEIAERQDIPQAFLTKIIQRLVQTGLLRAYRGAAGGIALAQPAEQINLRQIIEAVQGPIFLAHCLIQPGECPSQKTCPVHEVLMEMQNSILKILEDATLASLVTHSKELALGQRR